MSPCRRAQLIGIDRGGAGGDHCRINPSAFLLQPRGSLADRAVPQPPAINRHLAELVFFKEDIIAMQLQRVLILVISRVKGVLQPPHRPPPIINLRRILDRGDRNPIRIPIRKHLSPMPPKCRLLHQRLPQSVLFLQGTRENAHHQLVLHKGRHLQPCQVSGFAVAT